MLHNFKNLCKFIRDIYENIIYIDILIFISYTSKKGGDYMKFELNDNIIRYLNNIKLTEYSNMIITNLEEVLYSSNKNFLRGNKKITKDILVDLLINNIAILPKYNDKILNIFIDKSKNYPYISQIIVPINIHGSTYGSLILVNTKNYFDIESVRFLWTLKKNIEFYFIHKNKQTIRKYEYNEVFQKKFIEEIKNELDDKIYDLVVDRTYKNIDHLLLYVIDELRGNLNGKNLSLLNELIELYEQKKELHAIHGVVVGSKYKHAYQLKNILNLPNN